MLSLFFWTLAGLVFWSLIVPLAIVMVAGLLNRRAQRRRASSK
jgi:hypothetical protein